MLPALKLDLNGFELRDHSLRQRFSHLQHGMMILLVRELTRNLPPLTEIELHGNRIRPNDAKAARLVTTGSDLSFTLREQFASNTLSTVLAKDPQVANPLLIRYDHAHDLFISSSHPRQRPIFILELQGYGIRRKKVLECFIRHCLYQGRTESYSLGCGRRTMVI